MYPASNSSSTRTSHSLPAGFTPMLNAAPRTSTYGAGCPKICIRMCFNIPRAFSLIFRTLSSTTVSVRAPQTLPYPVVRLRPCYQRREIAGSVPGYVLRILWTHLRQPNPLPGNHLVVLGHTLAGACLSTRLARSCASPSPRVGWSVCPRLRRGCSGARTPVRRALLLEFEPDLARSSSGHSTPPPALGYRAVGHLAPCTCPIFRLLSHLLYFFLYLLPGFLSFLF